MEAVITTGDVLVYLEILVAVLLVVVLYHFLFIAVDLRKILRRFEDITQHVEDVIMKPIAMTDNILQWIMEYIEKEEKKGKKKGKKKLKKGSK
jgi:sensor histidine kinase YesM